MALFAGKEEAMPRLDGIKRAIFGCSLLALVTTIAACTTGSVLSLQPAVDVGSQTAAIPLAPAPMQPAPASTTLQPPAVLAGYPRIADPIPQTSFIPDDEADCRRELKKLRVEYRDLDPIRQGACGIEHPVQVSAIGSVKMKPAATLSCAMARSFAQWTRNELVPSARRRYFSGVDTIHQGSSYSCRKIADGRGVLSEHGKGNALDIMRIELNNGKDIDVKKPGLFAFRTRGFLNNVRADGCQYFNTVLGPGYNADHANHFHFDIKQRRNNYVACR